MIDQIIDDVLFEYERACDQFTGFHSMHEGYAVITEEVDELWELVRQKNSHKKGAKGRQECIQIAAMAIRMIVDRELT